MTESVFATVVDVTQMYRFGLSLSHCTLNVKRRVPKDDLGRKIAELLR